MSFERLDYYNLLSDNEIVTCFCNLFGSSYQRSVSDMLDSLLIYAFKFQFNNFTNKELVILSMYFDIRKSLYLIDFRKIYPVFRKNIESLLYDTNIEMIKNLSKTLELDIDIPKETSNQEIYLSFCCSPTTKSSYIRCCSPSDDSLFDEF